MFLRNGRFYNDSEVLLQLMQIPHVTHVCLPLKSTSTKSLILTKPSSSAPRIHSLKHSPSDPQLNRPNTAQSRSLGRNFVAPTPPLSARNHHNTNGSSSARRPPNKAQVAPSPKTEIRVAQLKPSMQQQQQHHHHHQQEVEDKHVELISMTADKPYGLDVDSFLPVRYRYSLCVCIHAM